MKSRNLLLLLDLGGYRRAQLHITLSVLLPILSLGSGVTLAECLWPGFPDELLSDGDTVTCTGVTGNFISNPSGVTINVTSGALVNALQLGPANHVRNFGEVHSILFVGPDFTADNFGLITNSIDASEGAPSGAIITFVNGPGTINNGVFAPDPFNPVAPTGEIFTSGDYLAGIFVRDPTAPVSISNDIAYGFDPVLDPITGVQITDNDGNPVFEEVIRGQGSITTTGFGAHGIYIVNDEAPGSAEISNDGFIETQGMQSAGIFVEPLFGEIPVSQEVRVDNGEVANIVTNGQDAQGILVYAGDVQITNRGVIETRESDSAGIEAIGLTSISIINWLDGRISTQGLTFSPGIVASGGTPILGSTVQNNGNIATIGADSPGIVILGGSHIVTSSCGDGVSCSITTTCDGSAGIQLGLVLGTEIDEPSNFGEVFNGGIIATWGFFAPGIATLGTANDVNNSIAASIATVGDGSPGIQLSGNVSTGSNFGAIATHGAASPGIQSSGNFSTGSNFGGIETHGAISPGIQVIGDDSLAENHGIIETHGAESSGLSGSGGSSIDLEHSSGSIRTNGSNSPGIELESLIGLIDVAAPIETVGENSDGIRGQGAQFTDVSLFSVNVGPSGSIITSARNADGIEVDAGNSRIITSGAIWTLGDFAQGIQLQTFGGLVRNSGSIATIGNFAQGIYADASKDELVNTIENTAIGTIVTNGTDADGILALYSLYQISNAGGISTSGARSDGVRIHTLGAFEKVLDPLVINNSGEITVAGIGSAGVRIETQLLETTNIENTSTGRISSNNIAISGGDGFENLTNRGLINGDIQLGAARDTVINDGVINGNVDLGGTGDEFTRGAGSAVNGIVDAGELDEDFSEDMLNLITVSGNEVVDGSKYVNFEQTHVAGTGAMTLNGTLNTELTTVNRVTLYVEGRLESLPAGVNVINGGVLGGNGTVLGDVELQPGGSINPGASIGSLTIEGDLFLDGGILEFEADSLFDTDELFVSGDAILNEGFFDVTLGFIPAPEDILDFLMVGGTLGILDGFGGIRGIAAAGSGVPLGTQFTVALGEDLYQGIVTSAVPIPAAIWLFGSGLIGLIGMARRNKV